MVGRSRVVKERSTTVKANLHMHCFRTNYFCRFFYVRERTWYLCFTAGGLGRDPPRRVYIFFPESYLTIERGRGARRILSTGVGYRERSNEARVAKLFENRSEFRMRVVSEKCSHGTDK